MSFAEAVRESAAAEGIPFGEGLIVGDDVSLRRYTTLRAGGRAELFAEPANTSELKLLLRTAAAYGIKVGVIGNGSDVLVSDTGVPGLTIRIAGKMHRGIRETSVSDDVVELTVSAGCPLSVFGGGCTDRGLSGAEFACGIPGTVGGAVYMNAGAYGREMKDLVTEVEYLDGNAELCRISSVDCGFSYRHSCFEESDGIIVSVKTELHRGNPVEIAEYVSVLREKRAASQPLDVPSAGSTFKRPEGDYAARLIEAAGLKGFSLDSSGAAVSSKHAGFVVNNGGTASASDVYRLIRYIRQKVFENSGVYLEPEIRFLGSFEE